MAARGADFDVGSGDGVGVGPPRLNVSSWSIFVTFGNSPSLINLVLFQTSFEAVAAKVGSFVFVVIFFKIFSLAILAS